jgi:hypothetical protein
MKRILLFCTMSTFLILILVSCKKDTPVPTCSFEAVVDGYNVTFTSTVTDVSTYKWEFGDDSVSTAANPVHSYLMSGTYTVKLTVKGDGGEATVSHDVQTLPAFAEMLTGGPAATNGKTWVLSTGYIEGVDGGSAVEPSMTILFGSAANILTGIGFPEEYDNEFTFYSNGNYKVDNKNGKSIAGLLYGMFGAEGELVHNAASDAVGLGTKDYTAPASATWTLHEDDLVITASIYGGLDVPAVTYDVTFTGKKWIELSADAYFGILDYPTTRKFIVKSITPESMSVAVFIGAYWSAPSVSGMYPALMYHQTYVPKP